MTQRQTSIAFALAAVLATAGLARAEAKVTVEHNTGDSATAAFTFKGVPAPAKTKDLTVKPTVTIVDGEKDDNSGHEAADVATGSLPGEEDAPDSNFFFKDGTEGGRLKIDLGSVVPVKAVDTYSWHTSTRAPQVYKLYAADGTAAGFNASPKKGTDPTTCGWTLITSVDTRPKGGGEPGGQYGVSVADPNGPLGKFRYVLLDAARTETDDDFGNTFYSRVDVVTAGGPAAAPAADPSKVGQTSAGPSLTPGK